MEPSTVPVYAPEPPRPHRVLFVTLVVGAIAALIAGLAYWFMAGGLPAVLTGGANPHLYAQIGFFPGSALRELKDGSFSEFVPLAGIPDGTFVTDRVAAGDTTYYLVLDIKKLMSTVYLVKGTDAPVMIPSSATVKRDLAYDAATQSLIYLSGTVSKTDEFMTKRDWKVTKFAPQTRTETVLSANGLDFALLSTSHTALVSSGSALSVLDLTTGQVRKLLDVKGRTPFAVNEAGTELALVNQVTGAVDLYTLAKDTMMPSYASSKTVPATPTALTYMNGMLYGAGGGKGSFVFFVVGGASETVPSPRPADTMQIQRIVAP